MIHLFIIFLLLFIIIVLGMIHSLSNNKTSAKEYLIMNSVASLIVFIGFELIYWIVYYIAIR